MDVKVEGDELGLLDLGEAFLVVSNVIQEEFVFDDFKGFGGDSEVQRELKLAHFLGFDVPQYLIQLIDSLLGHGQLLSLVDVELPLLNSQLDVLFDEVSQVLKEHRVTLGLVDEVINPLGKFEQLSVDLVIQLLLKLLIIPDVFRVQVEIEKSKSCFIS